jgi:formylmethanofuran:tetrahydromethanopterin formyltransferase
VEEGVTIPLAGVMETLNYLVPLFVTGGCVMAADIIANLKANRATSIDKLCQADDTTYETKIDEIVNEVKNIVTDGAKKQLIQDIIEGYFKSPAVQGVILPQ